ncbi:GNAT family N-acetyltransferase [Kitasatospora sp. RB6PN24]|uniref:GNAT family N-acetyltransferase n=1 Tax=Kitasatospora humi TaxID=2893891 RepID=UPI001E53279E|nr:GNAT family N-acetyltransferase [Kitasatospora humi]MCC9308820.1 GNAT family N-acetyltransferase [Kitasatospora humi]
MPTVFVTPGVTHAAELGRLLVTAWLETYPDPHAGIDEAWIRAAQGHQLTEQGIERWRAFLAEVQRAPADHFCRAVRSAPDGPLVGVVCGLRAEEVSLGPMYLLGSAQGRGTGSALMAEFLAWADPDPVALWVTEYNRSAVRFYARHGFTATGERTLWKGRLPNLRMVRPAGGVR